VVGFDWLLVFLQAHVHQSTVVLAMSILVRLLQQPTLLQCFRDGSSASGWLTDTECVVQNRVGVLLGTAPLVVFVMIIIIIMPLPVFVVQSSSQSPLGSLAIASGWHCM